MSPDDDYDTRRIDGLLASFGELMRAEAVLSERVGKHDQTLLDIRDMHRELGRELRGMVKDIGEVCEGHYRSVESKIDAQAKASAAEREKRRWTPMAIVGGIAAVGGPVATILVVLIDGSPK